NLNKINRVVDFVVKLSCEQNMILGAKWVAKDRDNAAKRALDRNRGTGRPERRPGRTTRRAKCRSLLSRPGSRAGGPSREPSVAIRWNCARCCPAVRLLNLN